MAASPESNHAPIYTILMQGAMWQREQPLRSPVSMRRGAGLAGGFVQPIDPDALKAAILKALAAELGELDRIKELPGFSRSAAASLSKAWAAGLNLAELAANARPEAVSRLTAIARLES